MIDTEGKPSSETAVSEVLEEKKQPEAAVEKQVENPKTYASGSASPAAKKILSEKGIQPNEIVGTGRDGRVTKQDAVDAVPSMGTPPIHGTREDSRKKLSMLRRKVAQRLVSAKNETAMLTTFNEVNMSPIFALRNEFKEAFKEKHNVGLGFMSFFTKAVVRALKLFPDVNSMIDGDHQIEYDYCDISVAVSGPKGLMVPVVRSAENYRLEVLRLK